MKLFPSCFLLVISSVFATATYSKTIDTIKQGEIKFKVLEKSTKSWDSKPLPGYLNGQPEITIIKVIIPPKTDIATHQHELINLGYLVKGQLQLTSESGERITLNEGDTIIELVDSWHSAKNEGDKEVEIIVFYLGPTSRPLAIYKEKKQDN